MHKPLYILVLLLPKERSTSSFTAVPNEAGLLVCIWAYETEDRSDKGHELFSHPHLEGLRTRHPFLSGCTTRANSVPLPASRPRLTGSLMRKDSLPRCTEVDEVSCLPRRLQAAMARLHVPGRSMDGVLMVDFFPPVQGWCQMQYDHTNTRTIRQSSKPLLFKCHPGQVVTALLPALHAISVATSFCIRGTTNHLPNPCLTRLTSQIETLDRSLRSARAQRPRNFPRPRQSGM